MSELVNPLGPPPPPPTAGSTRTPRRPKAQATRRRILDAARGLFVERGYVATTIEAIAAEAGVAVPTVYLAFGTKRGLLVIEQGWAPEDWERWAADTLAAQLLPAHGTATPARLPGPRWTKRGCGRHHRSWEASGTGPTAARFRILPPGRITACVPPRRRHPAQREGHRLCRRDRVATADTRARLAQPAPDRQRSRRSALGCGGCTEPRRSGCSPPGPARTPC